MSAANGSTVPGETVTNVKGKGKAVEQPQPAQNYDMSMDEDEDTSEAESGNDEPAIGVEEEADEDNMEEIDTSNILGRRTRGKTIDFAQAAKEAGDTLGEDDDEDDDEDFNEVEQGDGGVMEE